MATICGQPLDISSIAEERLTLPPSFPAARVDDFAIIVEFFSQYPTEHALTAGHVCDRLDGVAVASTDERGKGLKPFGMRAMMSLRLEKSFGSWMREYKPDYSAAETGLDRFVRFGKNDFIGREAAVAERDNPPPRRLVTFIVDADDADVNGDEPIWKGGDVVGFVTSGGYAHYAEKSVAIGFVPTEMIADGAAFEIEILGEKRAATIFTETLFDPKTEQMRG